MKYLNGVILSMFLATQTFAVSVDFYDEQQNNPSTTGIRLRINNDSNTPINNAKLRYYFHNNSQPYAIDDHNLADATITVTNVTDDLAYFEISIPSIPVGYYPDMAGFSLALHNTDWSNRNKAQDYSYQATASLTENTKVILLSGNDVLFGVSPNTQSTTASEILKISGLKFTDNSWLEIKNVGNSTVALSDYQLVSANNSSWTLNGTLNAGEVFRVCQNQSACGSANKSQVLPNFEWRHNGEALLVQNNTMISYVAWGQPGAHANDAVDASVWIDAQAFFPAETQVQTFNANYTKNSFFRLKSNKSGANINDWFSFTSNDNPTEEVSVPLPIKTSANKPVFQQIPGDNEVLFSWLPVQGVNSYRVIVRDQNNNDVYNLSTLNTSVSLALTQGLYSWTVLGGDEYDKEKCYKRVNGDCLDRQIYEHFGIQKANINTSIFKQLQIHKIAARRDTRMLNLYYGYASHKYSWDRPNLDAAFYEPTEDGRCWAIAIQVMNHFYGGNLTQDEIVYKTKLVEGDPLLSPFFNDGNNFDDLEPTSLTYPKGNLGEALKWALHTNTLNYSKGSPSYTTVKNAIDNNKLIFVNIPGHSMVIFGYVGDADNHAFYYAFSDNDGHISNSLYHDEEIIEYSIPEVTYGDVEMSKNTVHIDSDGDGITDFEEINRFSTNPLLIDSDNDGIEDKREIYEYTVALEKNKTHLVFNPYEAWRRDSEGHRSVDKYRIYEEFDIFYNKADKNGNLIFAENDPDDNDDGIEDGLKGKDAVIDMDVPEDYTIFGREYVRINDRVKCYNTSMVSNLYCNVASSDENKFSYDISYAPINIGVHTHVGNIDVRSVDFIKYADGYAYPGTHSNPVLRNSSVIHGNVNLYAVPFYANASNILKSAKDPEEAIAIYLKSKNPLDYISMQKEAFVEGSVTLAYDKDWTKEFTYTYSTSMPAISTSQTKVVKNGQTYRLKDGDTFSTLHVEAGGTLIIEPGEMFVDKKLQIETNSTVRFAEPGKGTVLHTNGDIIWRTYNSEPATNTQYWVTVARGFKLAHHSSQSFYIGGLWAGTIYAPKAKVVMGQVNKTIFGRILGRDVIVHQNSNVYRVNFNPTDALQVVYAF